MLGFLRALLARVSREPRHPDERRIPYVGRTVAAVRVNPDDAVRISAVWACLRYLSQTVAVLPWHVMRDGERGPEVRYRNPIDYLICHRPSLEWSSFAFRETLTHWALRWGNGYAEIERDVIGRPIALHPLHPERVKPKRNMDTGRLYYEVSNGDGGLVDLDMMDVFHVRGFGEGPVGVNVVEYAAESLGWAKAAQLFGAAFFGNGANLGGVVTNQTPLSLEALAQQRKEFDNLFRGPTKAHRTAHIDAGATFTPLGVEPEKAQFIETQQHLVEEICRWFGAPPHKVMHLLRATFSNIEHQSIEVVVDSVSPWVKRFEDEANFKLFGVNRSRYYTKMNMNALLRGDMKARMEFYKGMHSVGAYSPNRILELEDEQTLGPEGDIHVMQSQFVPLSRIGEEPATAREIGGNGGPSLDEPDAPVDDADAATAAAALDRFERMMGGELVG